MMRRLKTASFMTLVLASSLVQADSFEIRGAQVYFSPAGGAKVALLEEIASAKKEVLVQAFNFTDKDISHALIAAHRRGVDVKVIADAKAAKKKKAQAQIIARAGVATYIDSEHRTAHNKIVIVDGARVITGSYNFVPQAETKNAENLLVLPSAELAQRYRQEWTTHQKHSELLRQ